MATPQVATATKTKAVTNTQLAVATLALLGAAGLAFLLAMGSPLGGRIVGALAWGALTFLVPFVAGFTGQFATRHRRTRATYAEPA